MPDILEGSVERITYINEDSGFGVIKVKARAYPELVPVVGSLASVNVGATLVMHGEWKFDSKYGRQFSVTTYSESFPATVQGIEKYLGSGLIKGVGPVYSRRIVQYFKDDTIRVIEEETDRLLEVEGIGQRKLAMIKAAWQEQKEIKNVMLFLQDHGVSVTYAVKIFKRYGNDSIRMVRENPYRLADDIWGIGFKTADRIAQNLGFEKDSPYRCRSGIIYILNELSNEGHCFAFHDQLVANAVNMLEISVDTVDSCIDSMIREHDVIKCDDDSIYLPAFFHSEAGTAARIKTILAARGGNGLLADYACIGGKDGITCIDGINDIIAEVGAECGIDYGPIQKEAVKSAAASKFMILTGGPGTGKTTVTLAIIKMYMKLGLRVMLAAPTGRAARRLTEVTGIEARTIHRLLEYKPGEGHGKDKDDPLQCDALIVDESSMIDIVLMYNLLKAVPDGARVLLVGDADQLPSVGPGNVLRDIMESGTVKVVRLEKIFRQARGSDIVMNAHRINKGQFPLLATPKGSDFFFIEEDDPAKAVERIKELCSRRLPQYYGADPVNDIQVLCPMQRGEAGTHNLNAVLQELLNPSEISVRCGGLQFKLRDKVMQIKNNYDKGVFNGDIGTITGVDQEDKLVTIGFDNREVQYEITEMDELVLAYAVTIHKSQGSEYGIVVAPLLTQHYIMLRRNLLYTCITRAKKTLVLVGSKKAVAIAIRNNTAVRRNTMLEKRLRDEGECQGE